VINDELVELRGDVPSEVVAVIDAVVQATPGANRMSVVRDVLSAWSRQKVHEATLVHRLAKAHGIAAEPGGKR
jgi:hypothetical protein